MIIEKLIHDRQFQAFQIVMNPLIDQSTHRPTSSANVS
jgi:hypothetical protein